jgi:hypothetical protein
VSACIIYPETIAKRKIQGVKRVTEQFMDRTNTTGKKWLVCTTFITLLLNHTVGANGKIPGATFKSEVSDVSMFVGSHWNEPIFNADHDAPSFPNPSEKSGRWFGPHTHCGDVLTYKILKNEETGKLLTRSPIRSARDPLYVNKRDNATAHDGEKEAKEQLRLESEHIGPDPSEVHLPRFAPDELPGMTSLHKIGEETFQTKEKNGEWEEGSRPWEPLTQICKNDLVTVTRYEKENGLLDTDGWRRFRRIADCDKMYKRMVEMKSSHQAIRYQFVLQVRETQETLSSLPNRMRTADGRTQ